MKTLIFAASVASAAAMLPAIGHAQAVSPTGQIDALEALAGKQPTFRRSQAKGVCASGYFVGNPAGRGLSSAAVFNGDKVPVIARFSVGGGSPKASEKAKSVRGLALQFTLANGEQWMTANISAPVYFVSKPEQFEPFVRARAADPATGKPDAEKLKAFNEANPETLLQGAYLAKAPVPASYATVPYWSTNAFELVNAKGDSQFVRWQFAPDAGVVGLTDEQTKSLPDEFLGDELRARVANAAATFDFKLQLAEKGDQTTDPTQQWPESRKWVSAGKLTIDKVVATAGGDCDKISFIPVVLPKGIKPSADPVLLARAPAYAVSLGRRLSETAK